MDAAEKNPFAPAIASLEISDARALIGYIMRNHLFLHDMYAITAEDWVGAALPRGESARP